MSLGERVQARVRKVLFGIGPNIEVGLTDTDSPQGRVDVRCRPGRVDGRDWEIRLPVAYGGEKVVPGAAGIHSAPPEGAYGYVCDAGSADADAVPAAVRALARRIEATVHGADLQEIPLSPMARALLDGLRDITVAHAQEDEAALAEAMASGRDLVLTYRPSLASMLPPVGSGPKP